jgi:hypothetical protein
MLKPLGEGSGEGDKRRFELPLTPAFSRWEGEKGRNANSDGKEFLNLSWWAFCRK